MMTKGNKYKTEYGPSIVTEVDHDAQEFTVQLLNVCGSGNPRTPISDDDLYRTLPFCPDCGEECYVVPLDNSFDFAGTHCTHGKSGTHKPEGYGDSVSDCCHAPRPAM